MRPPLKHITFLFLCFLSIVAAAQNVQTISYTTRDGLSSNSVYRTVIDKRGFLWIATENGLARFDGRKFETYTTAQGLTDNEIVDLFIDSSDIIWAIPFSRSPCYYNERKNRFENEKTDPELGKIDLANTHKAHLLQFGGISFSNNYRTLFIAKDGKTREFSNFMPPRSGAAQKIIEYAPGKLIFFSDDSIRYFDNGKIVRTLGFNKRITASEFIHNKIYLALTNSVIVYSVTSEGALTFISEIKFPFEIRIFCYTGKNFAITSFNGNTYLVDTVTLALKENVLSRVKVRNVLEDREGNTWLATMEEGLIKVQQKRISSFTGIPALVQNFNALIKTNKIIAGTNNGELYVYDGVYSVRRIQLADERKYDAWVRRIVETPAGIYVATQTGSFLFDNDATQIKQRFEGASNRSSKSALLINDSMLCLGTHAQAVKFNFITGKAIDSIARRVTTLAADRDGKIYIGSNNGLYRWDEDSLYFFADIHKSFPYRVNTISASQDGLIWVGLASDALLALKDGKLIESIPLGGIIPGNFCKSLLCNKPGELWLGTNKGLNRIEYNQDENGLRYSTTYFGIADGLSGEQVNDITIRNDTIYAATSSGISYLPASLSLPVAGIATFITRVTVNGEDQEVQDFYSLAYSKNDITIEFSGVDLTGFLPLFEYNINDGDWQRQDKIVLARLASGSYKIRIRAIKRDGSPSSQEAAISFHIRTPFWKSSIFWAAFALVAFTAIIYFFQKQNERRQKAALEKVLTEKKLAELEMQALKAQINPHFVFNCLNSIKGFIYERDYEQADKYLDKFSELLRSTMDNANAAIISLEEEIKYLDTYLQLEKLRFGDKFEYSITAVQSIDKANTYVPAMLLQPYVENAIRHGVRFLEKKKGKITISIEAEEGMVICSIDDNGIGREKAQRLKSEKHIEYQSRGMQLSRRRAELYNIEQEVIDKKDAHGNAAGTTVILRIPPTLKP
jgi:anti-sigma regulatory factor (Ser/Thr protein kinase)